jgi:hypothetical protein
VTLIRFNRRARLTMNTGPLRTILTKGSHVSPAMKNIVKKYTKEKAPGLPHVVLGGVVLTKDHLCHLKLTVGARITLEMVHMYLTMMREALSATPDTVVCNMKVSEHCVEEDNMVSWKELLTLDSALKKMEGTWSKLYVPWREPNSLALDAIVCMKPARGKVWR